MKKRLYFFTLVLLTLSQVGAQTLSVSVTPTAQCFSVSNNTYIAGSTPAGTSHYSWTVSGCSGSTSSLIAALGGSQIVVSFTCCGVQTITCAAWDYTTNINSPVQLGSPVITTATVHCPPVITTVASPTSVCAGKPSTLTAAGAQTYTWIQGSVIGSTLVVTPTVLSTYQVMGTSSLGCVGLSTVVVASNQLPNVTLSGLNACGGSTVVLNAGGNAINYAITGGVTNGVPFTLNANTCYTAVGLGVNGCTNSAVACLSVFPAPSLSISLSNPVICSGQSATLSGFGALSYTWLPNTINSSNAIVAPLANTCYTLVGSNGSCTAMTSSCITVNQAQPVTISGNTMICQGTTATLTANGASTYTWSNNATGNVMLFNPLTPTCYSVIGAGLNTCTSVAVACVIVNSSGITASASSPTVCLGTSVTFNALGGSNFSWVGGPSTASYNVIPGPSSVYTLNGVGANGCTGTATIAVTVNTSCSDVWPGDANSDGIIDNTDVFELGLAFNQTGPARTPGGNNYVAQYAANWTGTVSSGKNKAHADCNGDGTVDNSDTLAIFNNFGLTHAFRPAAEAAGNDVTIVAPAVAYVGQWNKADILLGDASNQMTQLYGVAFDVVFDASLMDNAYLKFLPSFLNASNQNVEFKKTDLTKGKVYSASVRTNGSNISGDGKIGEFYFKLKSVLPPNSKVDLELASTKRIGNNGQLGPLTHTGSSANTTSGMVGLRNTLSESLRIFPNPANNLIYIKGPDAGPIAYSIFDLTGRVVLTRTTRNSEQIDLSHLANGNYILKLDVEGEQAFRKLVVVHD